YVRLRMNDKVALGLTPLAQQQLEALTAKGWLDDEQHAGRSCLACGVRADAGAGVVSGVKTTWASGNCDPSREIRAVIQTLYAECETPVRLMEYLVHEGLRLVTDRLESVDGPEEFLERHGLES